jgi:hypothetical protein
VESCSGQGGAALAHPLAVPILSDANLLYLQVLSDQHLTSSLLKISTESGFFCLHLFLRFRNLNLTEREME